MDKAIQFVYIIKVLVWFLSMLGGPYSSEGGNEVTIMCSDHFMAKMGTIASIIQLYANNIQGKSPLHDAGQNCKSSLTQKITTQ